MVTTILIVCLMLGIVLLILASRKILAWSRGQAAATLIALGIIGFMPAIIMRAGIIDTTASRVIVAVVYVFVFSITGSVILNGKIARRNHER